MILGTIKVINKASTNNVQRVKLNAFKKIMTLCDCIQSKNANYNENEKHYIFKHFLNKIRYFKKLNNANINTIYYLIFYF